jgi:hypothetical protein
MAAELFKRARALFGRETPEAAPAELRKAQARFHAVTIAPGARACKEARALQGQRFLSREAPKLPLKNCGTPQCECHYEHYDDRRKGHRRAHDLGVSIDGYEGVEQRQKPKRGRRQTDGRGG